MIEAMVIVFVMIVAVLVYNIISLSNQIRKLQERSEPELPGYSKFLEDSRDAAFGYIEEVQEAIRDYKTTTESKKKPAIKESYARLISLLPEEES